MGSKPTPISTLPGANVQQGTPYWPNLDKETGPKTKDAIKQLYTVAQAHDTAIIQVHATSQENTTTIEKYVEQVATNTSAISTLKANVQSLQSSSSSTSTALTGGTTAQRPTNPTPFSSYLDTTLGYEIWWDGTLWVDAAGSPVPGSSTTLAGPTSARPTVPVLYSSYFDTTLGYPIWWTGTQWVNGSGFAVPSTTAPGSTSGTPIGGPTSGRPTSATFYTVYFDTTLGYPVWWTGTIWINSAGTSV